MALPLDRRSSKYYYVFHGRKANLPHVPSNCYVPITFTEAYMKSTLLLSLRGSRSTFFFLRNNKTNSFEEKKKENRKQRRKEFNERCILKYF